MVLALLLGMILPRMQPILAEIIPGVRVMVICTGDTLVTMTLTADGTPVETSDPIAENCITATPPTNAQSATRFWHVLASDFRHHFTIHTDRLADANRAALTSPSRAPPVFG